MSYRSYVVIMILQVKQMMMRYKVRITFFELI